MEIYVHESSLEACDEPLVVFPLIEGESELPDALRALDESAGGLVRRVIADGDFLGKAKECVVVHLPGDGPGRLALLGLGKAGDLDLETFRRAAGEAATLAKKLRTGRIAFALPGAGDLPVADQARAIVEAASLALYDFRRYRSKKPDDRREVERLTLVSAEVPPKEVMSAVSDGRIAADCTAFCRDLPNTPAADATPTWMAEQARDAAERTGLRFSVLERADMLAEGMGGLLGVAQGSVEPPKMVILEHNPGRDDLDTICLVGKGVTFDTGGISLKPGANMHEMKFDKSGACAVIAAMRGVAQMDLPLHVVGIAPLVENMPSGSAYRPGDVLTCSNGKTIEVLNTDAEGRLILADALVKAASYEPKAIVDLATLTGACVIALGKHTAGMVGTDDALAGKLSAAGDRTGERVWRLPLHKEYRKQIDSDVADMTNLGGKEAGAITAACLLAEFVGDVPWAHLDIAGTAWGSTERDYVRKGGTGFGPRLLLEFLSRW